MRFRGQRSPWLTGTTGRPTHPRRARLRPLADDGGTASRMFDKRATAMLNKSAVMNEETDKTVFHSINTLSE